MRVNEKFNTSWASSSTNPTGIFSKCVFSHTTGYSENIVTDVVPKMYELDRLFFVKHGEKNLVRWFENIDLTVALNGQYCADMVATLYNNKWSRLYAALVEALYDPIMNYKMTETEEYDGDDLHTGTDTAALTHGEEIETEYGKVDTVVHGEEIETEYGKVDTLAHGEQIATTYGKGQNTVHGEQIQTTYNTGEGNTHGEIITTKTKDNNGDTVETTIDSQDPSTVKNKVFGFNSTAVEGVMDSQTITTGTGKTSTKKHDEEAHTGTDNKTKTGTETDVHSGTDAVTLSGTDRDVHSGSDIDTLSGSDTVSHSGTDTDTLSGSDTVSHSGTDSNQTTYNSNMNKTFERELNREGNIGVTTSQQMLESEIELRKKMFYEIVMQDICEMFCIPIY